MSTRTSLLKLKHLCTASCSAAPAAGSRSAFARGWTRRRSRCPAEERAASLCPSVNEAQWQEVALCRAIETRMQLRSPSTVVPHDKSATGARGSCVGAASALSPVASCPGEQVVRRRIKPAQGRRAACARPLPVQRTTRVPVAAHLRRARLPQHAGSLVHTPSRLALPAAPRRLLPARQHTPLAGYFVFPGPTDSAPGTPVMSIIKVPCADFGVPPLAQAKSQADEPAASDDFRVRILPV